MDADLKNSTPKSLYGVLKNVSTEQSRQEFLLITNLMYLFMYLFIHFIFLHVSSIKCSSSGDRIVLIHHLVWLVCVTDCLVCRSWPAFYKNPQTPNFTKIRPVGDELFYADSRT